jgi:hypothetical protein
LNLVGHRVDQRDIAVARDNAAGNITNENSNNTFINLVAPQDSTPITFLMEQLAEEIRTNAQVTAFIDTLQMYLERHPYDGVDGLEAKLEHAGRSAEISLALRKKDLFARLLARYSMFDSAQHIFAYLLSKVETNFRLLVLPNLQGRTQAEIDQLFSTHLVGPCANEIKSGVFSLNAAIASGMVYWLAEQCYVRWHT